ncbi:LysR family transcriptional regulator [Sphingomonas sp. BN140010]|uniref:LysR family transcriptional regulator n=1 Tax=Sphingomonas arvum TaxID=2992113 RepID=A0ABT3JD04_9SPHN|nr:LysR family transcriptional regulator [Sphingomonas sp. BN140010]MCW3796921.1 LysR family transcriptional regulator [Sphingomonas sp. BN140010]
MRREADWNDWRHFLAVARAGSTLTAARELRVSQTTVARRIAALEEGLGLPLFERRPAGYALTAAAQALVPHAEAIEQAANAAEQRAFAQGREAIGSVRFTSEDIFVIGLLAPHLAEFHERFPAVRLGFDSSPGVRDLGAGEADVALRSSSKEQPAGVVGRPICRDDWTLYCSRDYAARHGVPHSIEDLHQHAIIGGGGGNLAEEYGDWIAAAGLTDRVTMEQGSATGLLAAVRSGLGIAALPAILADAEPDFIQCAPPPREKRRLWLLTHERVRHNPAVRAVIDFFYDKLMTHVRMLQAQRQEAA